MLKPSSRKLEELRHGAKYEYIQQRLLEMQHRADSVAYLAQYHRVKDVLLQLLLHLLWLSSVLSHRISAEVDVGPGYAGNAVEPEAADRS